jgi:YidC/Oxa1 family membrane protein insertase
MNKQSIIGLVLIFAIFIGYMWWMAPTKEEMTEMRAKQDSIMQAYNDSMAVVDSINIAHAKLEKLAAAGDSAAIKQLNVKPVQNLNLGAFNASLKGETGVLKVNNGNMTVEINNQGAMLQQVTLADYVTFDSLPLRLVTPTQENMNLVFSTSDNRVVNTQDLVFTPYVNDKPVSVNQALKIDKKTVVSLRASVATDSNDTAAHHATNAESYLEFRYTFQPKDYEVGFDIVFHNLDAIVQNTPYMDFQWNNTMHRQEKVDPSMKNARNRQKDPERMYTNIYYKPTKDHADELRMGRDDKKQVKTPVEWVAFKQQFFCAILMSSNDTMPFANADLMSKTNVDDTSSNYLIDMGSTIGLTYNGGNTVMPMRFYFGPSKYRDLRDMHRGFERMLPLGWGFFLIQWFSRFIIIPVFNFFEGFGLNYGIIIILLTLMLKLLLFPATYKSYRMSAVMRILKPEMDAINKKYPDQDQMMQKQQAMSRLQKSAGISPMAGCLPMLVQMPILWAMYRFYPASIELRQQSFLWCHDLSTYDSILNFGFNVPLYGDHMSLFCLLMFAMQFIYTAYTMKGQTNQGMPGMKLMMYFMPFMMLFIFNSQSAALNLYYFLNLVITMLEMMLIRYCTKEKKVRAQMVAYENNLKNKPQKKSKLQEKLAQMQKMSEEMQKQQQRR